MGMAKKWMMEQEERGYSFVEGNICASCFSNETLQLYIKNNAISKKCDYCGKSSRKNIAAKFDELMEVIVQGIALDWQDPVHEIAFESREGGYLADLTYSWDLISDYEITEHENVFQAITGSLNSDAWVEKDYYVGAINERLIYSWHAFSSAVMENKDSINTPPPEEDYYGAEIHPSFFLGNLENVVSALDENIELIKTIAAGSNLFRIRVSNHKLSGAKELGAPPIQFATQPNRMSPAGISMFYGSFDEKTAFLETYSHDLAQANEVINVGKFVTRKPLRVLDIGHLVGVPSVFDIEKQHLVKSLRFLHDFAYEIARPIERSGAKHIEYVPTQVVTEYFRDTYKHLGQKIDGIIYKSSRQGGKTACVLFCDNSGTCDSDDVKNIKALMELSKVSYKRASDYV